jgi:very-short-patch-repair endonuclease
MGISVKEITEKLRKQVLERSKPFIDQCVKEGLSQNMIVQACKRQVENKMNEYYRSVHGPTRMNRVFDEVELTADSKAEMVFYDLLEKNDIEFKFHYNIGPYTADYFIPDDLVIELDGPQHNKERDEKRDRYMQDMGYRVLRLPLWVVADDPQAVINEIKAAA